MSGKKCLDFISRSIIVIAFLLLVGFILLYTIPWYSINGNLKVGKKCYYPGQEVQMIMNKSSLLNTKGHVVRSLIRVSKDDIYHKVSESFCWTSLERGNGFVETLYVLPGQCDDLLRPPDCVNYQENTYKWVGHVTYRPFGLIERYVKFESDTFQIRLIKDSKFPSIFNSQ